MKYYESTGAKCPFYSGESSIRIICEGVQKNSNVHVIFGTSEQRKKYSLAYCQENYKKCVQYQGLMCKYKDK